MKLEIVDKTGIRLIELDPTKKYFLVTAKENMPQLVQCKFEAKFRKMMASKYVFIVDDINSISFEEKQEFTKKLLEE